MPDTTTITVRSYRVCFDLERRIHKLDRWRIPLPYGVPVRGLAYFGALLALVLALSHLPGPDILLGALPLPVLVAVIPGVAATLLTRWRVDGRSAHQAALAWLRLKSEPHRVAAFRPVPCPGTVQFDAVVLAPDERSSCLRRGVVQGPARVVLRYPVHARPRGRELRVTQVADEQLWRGKQVELKPGQRMVVR